MFGIFKKKSWTINKDVNQFLQKLFTQLPSEFQFLREHLHKGLYRGYGFNKDNNYFISFDSFQSDSSMVKGKNFQIENIRVISNGEQYLLRLTIYQGLLVGFDCPKNIKDFKDYEFDTSTMFKSKSKFAAENNIARLVKGVHSDKLDLEDLSEIEVEGKSYYQVKDLENGNYIAIDSKGQVYGLKHDPFTIKLLDKSVKNFVENVNNGTFKSKEFL